MDGSRFEDSVRKLVQRAWAGEFATGPRLAAVQAENGYVLLGAAACWKQVPASCRRACVSKQEAHRHVCQAPSAPGATVTRPSCCLRCRVHELYSVKHLAALLTFQAKRRFVSAGDEYCSKVHGPGCRDCQTCHFCR